MRYAIVIRNEREEVKMICLNVYLDYIWMVMDKY